MRESLIEIKNIGLAFPNMEREILSKINYQVQDQDFVILLGSNGSGKSSLLKILDRRYVATRGMVKVAGEKLSDYKDQGFCHKITTLTQNCLDSLFSSLTVLENCLLVRQRTVRDLYRIRTKKDRYFCAEYLERFNVKLAAKLDTVVGLLSGGEQQALALALAILQQPKILLLDEHTSALDPRSAERLMRITAQVVAEYKITCLLATHNLEIALNYGNRILALQNGCVLHCIESAEKKNLTQERLLHLCY